MRRSGSQVVDLERAIVEDNEIWIHRTVPRRRRCGPGSDHRFYLAVARSLLLSHVGDTEVVKGAEAQAIATDQPGGRRARARAAGRADQGRRQAQGGVVRFGQESAWPRATCWRRPPRRWPYTLVSLHRSPTQDAGGPHRQRAGQHMAGVPAGQGAQDVRHAGRREELPQAGRHGKPDDVTEGTRGLLRVRVRAAVALPALTAGQPGHLWHRAARAWACCRPAATPSAG